MLYELAALAAAMSGQPDRAAGAECVVGKVSEVQRRRIADEIMSGEVNAQRELGPLLGAQKACEASARWTAEESEAVRALALATIVAGRAREHLVERGIDVGFVDRWFAGRLESVRSTGHLSSDAYRELYAAMRAAGASEESVDANSLLIGAYLDARSVMALLGDGTKP